MPSIDLTLYGISLEVEYDYQPEERMTQEYPGCPEEVEIGVVSHKGEDISDLLSTVVIDKLTDTILDRIQDKRYD
jgi:hypothetical protein